VVSYESKIAWGITDLGKFCLGKFCLGETPDANIGPVAVPKMEIGSILTKNCERNRLDISMLWL